MNNWTTRTVDFLKNVFARTRATIHKLSEHRFSDEEGMYWVTRTIDFLKNVFAVTRATIRRFSDEEGMHLAAGIAYYALLSIFPVALLFITIFSYFTNGDKVIQWVIDSFGQKTAIQLDFLGNAVEVASQNRGNAGILGILGTILSSTLVFAAIMRSINRAWGVAGTGNRRFWRRKLWELGLLMGMASLFILSFAAVSFFGILGRKFSVSIDNSFGEFFFSLIPFAVTAGILLLLYRFIPTTKVKWRDVWLPSLLAAAAILLANKLLTWYMNNLSHYGALYGSMASVIVLVLWIYMCANILIIGAALCSVLAHFRNKSSSHEGTAGYLTSGGEKLSPPFGDC